MNRDLLNLVPDGATHTLVEERQHRGEPAWAVIAIVPHGASIVLNGYSSRELADSTSEWLNRTLQGQRVEALLGSMPNGFRFRLDNVSRAYAGCWERQDNGLWNQITAPDAPLVHNMDGHHLGFVVGYDAVYAAVVEYASDEIRAAI